MVLLAKRQIELAIDTVLIKTLDVAFSIQKSLRPDPNTAEIRVYNMTDEQRETIARAKAPIVRLSAGYQDGMNQIWYGQLIHVENTIEGGDIITTLSTGDGAEEYKKARISLSFGPRTKTSTVIRAIAKELGIGAGNVAKIASEIDKSVKADLYISGAAFSGSAARAMTQVCLSAGLEWSIQDGKLQIMNRGKALESEAILLTPDTGLIGTPTLSNNGIVSGTCLLVPDIFPGRQIKIESRFVKGSYRIETLHYSGSTFGEEWYAEFEAADRIRIGDQIGKK